MPWKEKNQLSPTQRRNKKFFLIPKKEGIETQTEKKKLKQTARSRQRKICFQIIYLYK